MSAPEGRPSGPVPRAAMRVAVAGAAVLALLAAVTFYYAAQANRRSDVGSVYQVAITARACDPGEITVPAGRTVFEIVNRSDRPVEWEILDGVMVVEERENIPPGFSQTLAARLAPGEYQITCGLLSNPRGTLHVRATGQLSTSPCRTCAPSSARTPNTRCSSASRARRWLRRPAG